MANLNRYGEWAAVIGAAEGIGAAYCEEVAKPGLNILIIDIKKDESEKLRQRLQKDNGLNTEVLILDLNDENSAERIAERVKVLSCRLVIYNAAYGPVKSFVDNSLEEIDRYINVNSRTLIHLIHRLIPIWKGEKAGIIIMSSLAGLFGTRLVAPYSATKAFDLNLGEALHHELKPQNIDVLVCCAGATNTPNFRNTKPDLVIFPKPHIAEPSLVAKEAINNLGKKALHIAGFQNRMNYFFLSRVLSRKTASSIFNSTMKRLYAFVK